MNREQDIDQLRETSAGRSTALKKPYESPSLKEFGPMRDLTKLDAGPSEDFIAYGGSS